MRLPSLLAAALAGGCIYSPGSFHDQVRPFPGKRVSRGCIDLAVTMTQDALATGPVIEYTFGNGCLHAVTVDLASIRAVGKVGGGDVALAAYDPKQEIVPLRLDALWRGSERIEYHAATGVSTPAVCVDVGRVDRSAPATTDWQCVAMWSEP